MPAKKTTVDIDLAVQHRPLTRMGDYKNYDTKITWRCNTCTHEWDATPNNVISKNSGCPKCGQIKSGKSKSGGQLDRVTSTLLERGITLVSPYTRIKDHHDLKCNACSHEWSTTLNVLLNSKTISRGCAQCSGLVRLTNEEIDRRLEGRTDGIVRVGNYINATTKIEWRCAKNHTWKSIPDSVVNAGVGCNKCRAVSFRFRKYYGSNPDVDNLPCNLYLAQGKCGDDSFLKVGVSVKQFNQRYSKAIRERFDLESVYQLSTTIIEAITAEHDFIEKWCSNSYAPAQRFDGSTECFIYSQEIIDDFRATYCPD